MKFEEISRALREQVRHGAETDRPEGARYIMMSDTLANQIADAIDEAVKAQHTEPTRI